MSVQTQSGQLSAQEKRRTWMAISSVFLGYESAAGVSERLYKRGYTTRQHIPYVTDVVQVRPRRDQVAAAGVVAVIVYHHFRGRI